MKLETTIILPLSSDSNPTLALLLSVSLWPCRVPTVWQLAAETYRKSLDLPSDLQLERWGSLRLGSPFQTPSTTYLLFQEALRVRQVGNDKF